MKDQYAEYIALGEVVLRVTEKYGGYVCGVYVQSITSIKVSRTEDGSLLVTVDCLVNFDPADRKLLKITHSGEYTVRWNSL